MQTYDKISDTFLQYNDKTYIQRLKKIDDNLNQIIGEIIDYQYGEDSIIEAYPVIEQSILDKLVGVDPIEVVDGVISDNS